MIEASSDVGMPRNTSGRARGVPRADKPAFFGTFVTFIAATHMTSHAHKVQQLTLLMLNTPMLPSGTLHIPWAILFETPLCYSHALPLSL